MASSGAMNVGSVAFKIIANQNSFKKEITSAAGTAKNVMSSAMKAVSGAVGAAFSVTAVIKFGKECVKAASESESAWKGLSSILNGQGKSFSEANSFIKEYISDGLIPLNNAVLAYKNLAARGYDSTQIERVMTALKDSAAYGRQASYSYGDAITSATEGLKNENSILVDNAGVTKNVAKMWEDYAKSIGTTSNKLTQQQKIQAEVNGIIEETKWQTGDAASYANTFAGRIAKLSARFTELKTAVGEVVISIINLVLPGIQLLLDCLLKAANAAKSLMGALGFQMPDYSSLGNGASKAATAIASTGDAAVDAAKKAQKAKNSFAAYDEINKITSSSAASSSSDGASGSAGASSAIADTAVKAASAASEAGSRVDLLKEKIAGLSAFLKQEFSEDFQTLTQRLQESKGIAASIWNDIKSLGSPLKSWVKEELSTYLLTVSHSALETVSGLWDSLNLVFSTSWDSFIFPCIEKFVTVGLPVITQFATKATESATNLFLSVKEIFDAVWVGGVVPALEFVSTIWSDLWDDAKAKWDEYGQPIFDGINTAIQKTKEIILTAWYKLIKPCWDAVIAALKELWEEHLKPLWENVSAFVAELIDSALKIYNKFISPIVKWVQEHLYPIWIVCFRGMLNILKSIVAGIIDRINGIVTVLRGIIKFITGVFTGDWKKAWDGVKQIFAGIWKTLSATIKTPLNIVLSVVENFINKIIFSINFLTRQINKIKLDVPDWVPIIGGKNFGFNVKSVSEVSLPRLAEGGWLAANNPRLIIAGDNKHEPEIVTPESKIKEQCVQALKELGVAKQKIELILEILVKYPDGRQIIKKINAAQLEAGRVLLEV